MIAAFSHTSDLLSGPAPRSHKQFAEFIQHVGARGRPLGDTETHGDQPSDTEEDEEERQWRRALTHTSAKAATSRMAPVNAIPTSQPLGCHRRHRSATREEEQEE